MILFINACVRKGSRTKRLADHLLQKLEGPVREVKLIDQAFPTADERFLLAREEQIQKGDFSHPAFGWAREFAEADTIVIAAPFWDLSFPAVLKQYFEQINVLGVTFTYTPEGLPRGLCQAQELYYVTTAGGPILSDEYGFGYVKAMAEGYYGIPRVCQIKAEGLDIQGADAARLLREAEADADALFPGTIPSCEDRSLYCHPPAFLG